MRISDWSSDVCSSDLDLKSSRLLVIAVLPCPLQSQIYVVLRRLLRLLDERPHHDQPLTARREVDRPGDAVTARYAHLPQFGPQRADMRHSDLLGPLPLTFRQHGETAPECRSAARGLPSVLLP